MTHEMSVDEPGVVTKLSPRSVGDTVARMTGMLAAKGVRLFDTIDQRAAAREVGLDLRETVLMIFGNPAAGTAVMMAAPLSALDLPLKVLIWDDEGHTKVTYYAVEALAARHHLDPDLAANLSVVDPLTDALIAP
jgi:uncharacterized protein (DUF302 family)